MLTNDDIRQILELYAKGYSYRKIWEKTGFRENTIRKYINAFIEKIFALKEEGLDEEQIANRLDYPESFVNRVIEASDAGQKEDEKDKFEVEKPAVEEIEPSQVLDLKTDWADFKKKKELAQRREKIEQEVCGQIEFTQDSAKYFKSVGVYDVAYFNWQTEVQQKLEDFVLVKIHDMDSIEAIIELERIFKEIEEEISLIIQRYNDKVIAERERKKSDKLLEKRIGFPLFPENVRDYIKANFIVKNEAEVSIVSRALFEWVTFKHIQANDKQQRDASWQEFDLLLKQGKWEFLSNLALKYQERKSSRKSPAV